MQMAVKFSSCIGVQTPPRLPLIAERLHKPKPAGVDKVLVELGARDPEALPWFSDELGHGELCREGMMRDKSPASRQHIARFNARYFLRDFDLRGCRDRRKRYSTFCSVSPPNA